MPRRSQPDEVLASISIPTPPEGHGYAYEKQKRKVGDYATAAAAVMLTMSGGMCTSAAIALTNVGETPLFAGKARDAVLGHYCRRHCDLRSRTMCASDRKPVE